MPKGKVADIESLEQAEFRILRLEEKMRAVNEKLRGVDPSKIADATKTLEQNVNNLRETVSVMTLKLCIITELPRYMKQSRIQPNEYLMRLVAMMDMPDQWWRKRANMNIEGWGALLSQQGMAP